LLFPSAFAENDPMKNFSAPPSFFASASMCAAAITASISPRAIETEFAVAHEAFFRQPLDRGELGDAGDAGVEADEPGRTLLLYDAFRNACLTAGEKSTKTK
jgi:hypothetical protein